MNIFYFSMKRQLQCRKRSYFPEKATIQPKTQLYCRKRSYFTENAAISPKMQLYCRENATLVLKTQLCCRENAALVTKTQFQCRKRTLRRTRSSCDLPSEVPRRRSTHPERRYRFHLIEKRSSLLFKRTVRWCYVAGHFVACLNVAATNVAWYK